MGIRSADCSWINRNTTLLATGQQESPTVYIDSVRVYEPFDYVSVLPVSICEKATVNDEVVAGNMRGHITR